MKFTTVLLIASGLLIAITSIHAEAGRRGRGACTVKSVFPWHMTCSERDASPERSVRQERPNPPDKPDKDCKGKDDDDHGKRKY